MTLIDQAIRNGIKAAMETFGIKHRGGDISSLQGDNHWQRDWRDFKPNRSLTVSSFSERPL